MIRSMTAFATQQGNADPSGTAATWTWEVRSVNGRGMDVKVRLPDSAAGLEGDVRAQVAKVATRGNITIGLRLNTATADGSLQIDPARLDVILDALDTIQERAFDKGVTLAQPTAADVLSQRGVLMMGQAEVSDLSAPLAADFTLALDAMIAMRVAEGAALHSVISDQIDQIETLTTQAVTAATARREAVKTQVADALTRVMDAAVGADPDRIAQELALLAVKSDITEEIDRLGAHITAARDLMGVGGAVGRKLDFLTQEFNREANTLCSKAQDVALTQIGLALKAVIDQIREQVQNVE